jgi:uncharacterized membrane protein YdjX (TVP38/TMEM64 family)
MSKTTKVLLWQLAGLLGVIAIFFVISRFLPVVDFLAVLQERVVHLGVWSGFCYPLLFALCNVLLLPGGILSVGSGFFFGLWWGFTLVLVGNCISAAISFGVSRSIGQRWFTRKLSNNAILKNLEPAVEREGWKIIFLSQLHPLFPTSLLTYLYGLTRIRFGTYMLWTTMGRAPGLFLYTYLGTLGQFGVHVASGTSHPRLIEYWKWGGAFVTTVLLFFLLSRIALRAIHKSEADQERPGGSDVNHRLEERATPR